MTPALKFGQTIEISNLDLRALDVIGWDRSRSDIFVDYSQMLLEGKIILGQKLERNGDANLIDSYLNNGTSSLAADLLSENKTLEVISMILDSEIYTWGSWGSGGTCNTCWNQELIDFLAQASFFDQSLYWSTLSTSSVTTASAAASTPEPTALFGLAGLGLFVLKSLGKKREWSLDIVN